MTENHQIYRCEICGNVVEVLHNGAGQLVCCGQPMKLMEERDSDQGQEKHLPVVEILPEGGGIKIRIGEVPHPMEQNHRIEWVEIETDDHKRGKKFLKSGDVPEAKFHTLAKVVSVRAYCNVHGLWKLSLR